MTKKELLEWIQEKQEQAAVAKDLGYDETYDLEEVYIMLEKMIKELD